jgi:antitoxin component of RelBE/YafQ-DinJ toxin-antitoxin module
MKKEGSKEGLNNVVDIKKGKARLMAKTIKEKGLPFHSVSANELKKTLEKIEKKRAAKKE